MRDKLNKRVILRPKSRSTELKGLEELAFGASLIYPQILTDYRRFRILKSA